MRSLYTVLVSVAVCSVAVLAKSPFRPDDGSGSEYTPAPVASADPYATPAPVAQDASAPYAEETPTLVIEETSYSAATVDVYETPSPVADEGSGTEYTSAPTASVIECETHAPVADDGSGSEYTSALTPSVDAYGTPAPVARDTSAPIVEETPAPEEASGEYPSSYRRAHRRHRQADNTTADSTTTTKTRPSTTTMALPGMSTTARPGRNATEGSGNATATCSASAVCFHDDECGSTGDKKGRCIGVFNGKCNCNACINFLSCKDDSACGGLKGACNTTTSRCSCEEGFKANGFASFLDTLREFCNAKDCNADNSDKQCFGLPCHSGRCVC